MSGAGRRRLLPTSANGGAAFIVLTSPGAEQPFGAFAVLLLEAGEAGIARIDAFFEPRIVDR